MIRLASMSVVGIGGMDDSATIVKSSILSPSDFRLLGMKGAVGDVICHFIDKDGKLVDTEVDSRLVSVPLSTLKELENVIGVAAGKHKVPAIHAALTGGYLDLISNQPRFQKFPGQRTDSVKCFRNDLCDSGGGRSDSSRRGSGGDLYQTGKEKGERKAWD